MNFWIVLSYAAWIVSGVLLLWMVIDMLKVNKEYPEEYLISSREGEDIAPEDE